MLFVVLVARLQGSLLVIALASEYLLILAGQCSEFWMRIFHFYVNEKLNECLILSIRLNLTYAYIHS